MIHLHPTTMFSAYQQAAQISASASALTTQPQMPVTPEKPSMFGRAVRYLQPSTRDLEAPDAYGAWNDVRRNIDHELDQLRGLPSKAERENYLRSVGVFITHDIRRKLGLTGPIGFHFNAHGGSASDYLEQGGILATRGDIEVRYSRHGDSSRKVYFFDSDQHDLFSILNMKHPNLIESRMGTALMLFDLNSPYLLKAFEEGGASNRTAISIDFDPDWIKNQNGGRMVGIPSNTFLLPPLTVFEGVKKSIGHKGRLGRNGETLAVMRYIEASFWRYARSDLQIQDLLEIVKDEAPTRAA